MSDLPARPPSATRPASPRRAVPDGPLQPIPGTQQRLAEAQAAAAAATPANPSPLRPASAARVASSPRASDPVVATHPGVSTEQVQQWLLGQMSEWCLTNAQPLLGQFLGQWMELNAGALLTVKAQEIVAPLHANMQTLQQQISAQSAEIKSLQSELANVKSQMQAQLLSNLHPPSPSIPTVVSVPHPSAAAVAASSGTGTSPEGTGRVLGLGKRVGSAGPNRPQQPTLSEDGVQSHMSPADMMKKKLVGQTRPPSSGGLGLGLGGGGAGAAAAADGVQSGLPMPVRMQSTVLSDMPGPGEEVVSNLTPFEIQQQNKNATGRMQRPAGKAAGPIDIIVVEDVRVAQKLAHAALTRGHYKVEVADDGPSALELFRKHVGSLKAVLMDIQLPGMSGMEATQEMRKIEQEAGVQPVWIYGLTGNVSAEDLVNYKASGMNGCILKGKLLADAVRQAMEESSSGVEFVNLCDKQNAAGRTVSAPTPAPAAQQTSPVQPVPSFKISQIQKEPMGIQTPRAMEPRKLMQGRFEGSGQVKPGIGLPHANQAAAASAAPPAGSQPNMLLVEDVRVSQKIALKALERAGYKVIAADNGESAVEKFKQHANSLRYIIMDINLPGISGIEATEQVRALEKQAGSGAEPVLVLGLTGNVDAESLKNYEQAGMNGCILKGLPLAQAVTTALEKSHSGQFVSIC